MTYVATPSNPEAQVDSTVSEQFPKTPLAVGLATQFENDAKQWPVPVVVNHMIKTYREKYDPGTQLSGEATKEFYPHVADQFPDGGSESIIKTANEMKSTEITQEKIMGNMRKGFLTKVGQGVTGLAGMALSPTGFAAGSIVGGLGEKIGSAALSKFAASEASENVAKYAPRVIKSAVGAAEGVGVSLPLALSTKDYYEGIGMPYSKWNTIGFLATAAAGGGVLRTALGFKNVIAPDVRTTIDNVAVDQVAAGKNLNLKPLFTKGLYDARKLEVAEDVSPENLDKVQTALNEAHASAKTDLDSAQTEFDASLSEAKSKNKDVYSSSDNIPLEGKTLLDQFNDKQGIPIEQLSDDEKAFYKNMPQNKETKLGMQYKLIGRENLKPSQLKFLDRFETGDEAKLIREGVADRKARREENNITLNEMDQKENPAHAKKLLDENAAIEKDLIASSDRLKELRKLDSEPVALRKLRRKLLKAKTKVNALGEMVEQTEIYRKLKEGKNDPLTEEELKSASDDMNSWRANDTTDMGNFDKQEEISDSPISKEEAEAEEETDEDQEAIDKYVKDNPDVSDDIRNASSDLKKELRISGKIKAALDGLRGCFGLGGDD